MRRRISLALFALLIAAMAFGVSRLWRQLRPVLPREALQDRQYADYDRAYAYQLTDDWLEFELPPRSRHLRLLVNGLAGLAKAPDADRRFHISLQYRLSSDEGVLREGRHAFTTGHTRYVRDGREVAALIAPELGDRVLDGRLLRIDTGEKFPRRLALRLATAAGLNGVLVRLYAESGRRSITGELDQRIDLLRLQAADREKLAEPSVYPFELLPEAERLTLVARNESPLAPIGIAGEDYAITQLLLRRNLYPREEPAPVEPEGRLVSSAHRGVFSLPAATNWVFDLRPWPGLSNTGPVRIDWHGRDFIERLTERVIVPPGGVRWTNWFSPGVVEIRTPLALDIKLAEAARPATVHEHTPATAAFAALFSTNQSATWPIVHLPGVATPVRVDLRRPWWMNSNALPAAARIEFRDARKQVLQRHSVAGLTPFTPYDWADLGTNPVASVSRKHSVWFSAPPEAASVRVTATDSLLAGVYTRPGDVFHTLSVPGDFSEPLNSIEREPQWFAVEPQPVGTNHVTRVRLVTQRRPPRERPDLWSGSYRWEDLHPAGDWVARPLLAPRHPAEPFRDEALGSTFTPLTNGEARRVEFAHQDRLQSLRPTLLYLLPTARPTEVIVKLNGAEFWRGSVATRQGEQTLPALSAGYHELEITADGPGAFLVNHLRPVAESFTKRTAIRLTTNRFRIRFPKPTGDRAVLSARLFAPVDNLRERRVRTRLRIPRPAAGVALSGWTLDRRDYVIRPNPTGRTRVLLTKTEVVDGGRSFYVPFEADLPAGEYVVDFEVPDFAGCYLALSTLTPGEHAERTLRATPVTAAAPSLEHLLQESARGESVAPVTPAEEKAAQQLFEAVFAGRSLERLNQLAKPLNMAVTKVFVNGEAVTVVHELTGRETGRGFYAFRSQGSLVLQAPHRFFDRRTGEIVLRMFAEGRCRAAAWNTVHRWPDGDREDSSSDLARQASGWWAAFTRALARALPEGHCVQVHGYAKDKRITVGGKTADLILSAGVLEPPAKVRGIFSRLRSSLSVTCRLYPVDVGELGGTRNAQGRLLRELGHAGFIQLELSRELREQLAADAEWRRRVLNSLQP